MAFGRSLANTPTKETLSTFPSDCTRLFQAGLPDGLFSHQNPNLGKLWMALAWKMLAYFMAIWKILRPFGTFYDHLVI
jgi:hypothetical protein